MTPEDLASIHPNLYHVAEPDAWPMIKRHGLLSTFAALDLFGVDHEKRKEITEFCRTETVAITHHNHGRIVINDNKPMSEKALHKCLDNGLTPKDWLKILNRRVFFWSSKEGLDRLLNARMNQGRERLVLVFDTLRLAKAHKLQMEICPINSGSTIRKPARRGMHTFTPLPEMTYKAWRKKRGKNDKILEVTVLNHVPNVQNFVTERFIT
ncbi:MAG: hypothetical protein AAF571_14545 [Verrucomicrobiota bacterium]